MSDPVRMTARVDFIDDGATPPSVKKGAAFTASADDAKRLEQRGVAEPAPADKPARG